MPEQIRHGIYASGPWEINLARRELRYSGSPVPLGGRAFDILEVLVRSAGELVTKDELIASIWPGAIIEENTLQVHVSAVRKALGPDRGLLRTSSGRGYRLSGVWVTRDGHGAGAPVQADTSPESATKLTVVSRPPTNLPAPTSELVGRALAQEQLRDLASAYRVVTLTGPGGIGKTALALWAARSLLPEFNGDVWLIDLASLSDPALAPSAIAGVLGLRLGGEPILPSSIAHMIGQRRLLLLLDNCEHVIKAVAELAETVVRSCPHASILATSREALRIDGEYIYRVPPLEVPLSQHDAPNIIRNSSAVQLFIEKLKTLDSQVLSRDDSLMTIAAICRQLDGIPLAIEFAASRAATIGLQQVAARLADRFGLLIQGRRTASPRHQTLRAVLDWSYDLLSEPERYLLRQLAVFPAGFTLDAVASVVGGGTSPQSAVVDGVGSLVAKSLVTVDGAPTAGRWRLLETIRAYAFEKLEESGERQSVARRHAEFVRDRIASAELGSRLQIGNAEMVNLAGEVDNVRSALDWAFSPGGDAQLGAALTAGYVVVWLHLGSLMECRNRIEHVLEGTSPELQLSDAVRMHLHLGLGIALFFTAGPTERTRLVLRQALELATRLDDIIGQLRTLWVLWGLHLNVGECRAGLSAAEQFSSVARRSGDLTFIVYSDRLMGNALCYSGDQTNARELLQRVLQTPTVPNDRLDSIMLIHDLRLSVRIMLARVLWLQGFCHQARNMALACLKDAQTAAHNFSIYEALRIAVCPISLATGELAAAERYVGMMVDLATSSNVSFWIFAGRCLQAKLLVQRGEFEIGAAQVRLALQACDDSGWTICYPEYQGALAEALAGMGQLTEALAVLEDALARAERSGERWFVSELLRMKGEFLFRNGDPAAVELATKHFDEAILVARQQGALYCELRGGLSLARLELAQDQPERARRALLPIYQRFTEGLDTADLRAARVLLDSLPPPRAPATGP